MVAIVDFIFGRRDRESAVRALPGRHERLFDDIECIFRQLDPERPSRALLGR